MISVFCTRIKPNESAYLSRYEASLPRFLHIFFNESGHMLWQIKFLGISRIAFETPEYCIAKDEFVIDSTEKEMDAIAAAFYFFMQAYCSVKHRMDNAEKLRNRLFETRFRDFGPRTIYPEYSDGSFLPRDALRRLIAYFEGIEDERDIAAVCNLYIAIEDVILAIEEWNNAGRNVPLHELLR